MSPLTANDPAEKPAKPTDDERSERAGERFAVITGASGTLRFVSDPFPFDTRLENDVQRDASQTSRTDQRGCSPRATVSPPRLAPRRAIAAPVRSARTATSCDAIRRPSPALTVFRGSREKDGAAGDASSARDGRLERADPETAIGVLDVADDRLPSRTVDPSLEARDRSGNAKTSTRTDSVVVGRGGSVRGGTRCRGVRLVGDAGDGDEDH